MGWICKTTHRWVELVHIKMMQDYSYIAPRCHYKEHSVSVSPLSTSRAWRETSKVLNTSIPTMEGKRYRLSPPVSLHALRASDKTRSCTPNPNTIPLIMVGINTLFSLLFYTVHYCCHDVQYPSRLRNRSCYITTVRHINAHQKPENKSRHYFCDMGFAALAPPVFEQVQSSQGQDQHWALLKSKHHGFFWFQGRTYWVTGTGFIRKQVVCDQWATFKPIFLGDGGVCCAAQQIKFCFLLLLFFQSRFLVPVYDDKLW